MVTDDDKNGRSFLHLLFCWTTTADGTCFCPLLPNRFYDETTQTIVLSVYERACQLPFLLSVLFSTEALHGKERQASFITHPSVVLCHANL